MKTGTTGSFVFLLHLSYVLGLGYDGGDFEPWYQPVPHRPVDIVADVINDLGVRILQQYTAHGNVAFSPAGVGFVLAALYEGSVGRGSQQIADALGLPRDRDVTRIGFRDVHRRLRTYLNADGFLGGLTLNQENTRLRPEYEDVLRFYGFDLSVVEQGSNETTAGATTPEATIPETTPETLAVTPETDETTEPGKTSESDEATTAEEADSGGTEEPAASTTTSPVEQFATTLSTSEQEERVTRITTTSASTDAGSGGGVIFPGADSQTSQPDTTVPEEVPRTTASPETLPTTTTMTVTITTPTAMIDTVPESVPGITLTSPSDDKGTVAPVTDGSPDTTMDTRDPDGATVMLLPASSPSENEPATSTTTYPGSTEALTSTGTEANGEPSSAEGAGTGRTDPGVSELPAESTTTSEVTTSAEPGEEGSTIASAAVDSVSTTDPTSPGDDSKGTATGGSPADGNTVSTGPEPGTASTGGTPEIGTVDSMGTDGEPTTAAEEEPTTLSPSGNDDSTNRIRRRSVRSPRGYFSSYPDEGIWMQDLGIWKPYAAGVSEASVRDSTEISFLVNGCDVSSISASRYMAVLPFAYFPSLHAVALEFPLDDPRYNILLLMSTNRRDTYQLARDLGGKSLRLLRKQLQPTWVRATIPSFMLRGFVTLTSFLQRLGILDVFEPRAADLSVMTPDLGVYVRDVQQSIGVNIRNYMKPDRTHSRNGLFERAGPVPFTAVHPFLYFIVDAETSVALIAGRVNDPLNSRIL